jgi:NAD(P)-dependent dehydrogenase (short-subunit alcohol dehydrogenase family)
MQIALITGGDSGIGRSAALMFAREGADIAISYLNEDRDAEVWVQGLGTDHDAIGLLICPQCANGCWHAALGTCK